MGVLCIFLFAPRTIEDEVEVEASKEDKAEAKRLKRNDLSQGDLGELLAGTVDVTVLDAPRTLYRPKRNIPWGPTPTTGLTVTGTGKCRQ